MVKNHIEVKDHEVGSIKEATCVDKEVWKRMVKAIIEHQSEDACNAV